MMSPLPRPYSFNTLERVPLNAPIGTQYATFSFPSEHFSLTCKNRLLRTDKSSLRSIISSSTSHLFSSESVRRRFKAKIVFPVPAPPLTTNVLSSPATILSSISLKILKRASICSSFRHVYGEYLKSASLMSLPYGFLARFFWTSSFQIPGIFIS